MIDCVRTLPSKHGWLLLLLLGLSGWPSPVAAMTGNEWRDLPMAARTSYVTGVVDNLVDFGAAVRSLVPAEKRTASEKMLAACFLVTSIAFAFYGVSTQEGLLRENALLIEALRDRGGLRSEMPPQGKPSEPAPVAGAGVESSESSRALSSPTRINPRPRRSPEGPQKPLEYTVPEEEKWWNRP